MKRNALTLSLIAGASMLALAGNPAIAGSTSVDTNANGTVKTDQVNASGQTEAEIKKDIDKAGKVVDDAANSVATAAMATETKIRELLEGSKIDDIEGTAVRDANGESIGEIDEVVMGKSDKVLYFVTDVGGFLGLGEREVVIPASEFTRADDHFVLNSATKAELESRDEYSEDRYIDVEVNADGTIVAD